MSSSKERMTVHSRPSLGESSVQTVVRSIDDVCRPITLFLPFAVTPDLRTKQIEALAVIRRCNDDQLTMQYADPRDRNEEPQRLLDVII